MIKAHILNNIKSSDCNKREKNKRVSEKEEEDPPAHPEPSSPSRARHGAHHQMKETLTSETQHWV